MSLTQANNLFSDLKNSTSGEEFEIIKKKIKREVFDQQKRVLEALDLTLFNIPPFTQEQKKNVSEGLLQRFDNYVEIAFERENLKGTTPIIEATDAFFTNLVHSKNFLFVINHPHSALLKIKFVAKGAGKDPDISCNLLSSAEKPLF